MDIRDYDYELPKELIAQEPVANRSDARLLIVDRQRGAIDHAYVRDLPDWLRPHDCLVVNDSRVIPARLIGRRELTGGRWEGLFLEADEHGTWRMLCKTRGKMVDGELIQLFDRESRPVAKLQVLTRLPNAMWAVKPLIDEPAFDFLERAGRVPLPPYIRGGQMVDDDLTRYQTVYAEARGSVAAPTAGLHLTQPLLSKLSQQGVGIARVTLHVGVGTFRPIEVERIEDHQMHEEFGSISASAVQQLDSARQQGGRIVAVGTTSVRVLESSARLAPQTAWSGRTNLYIHPPFEFQRTDVLMTNFHLPRSSLLVLVRAFGGDELIRDAYAIAIQERYRFFSYGDAMLII